MILGPRLLNVLAWLLMSSMPVSAWALQEAWLPMAPVASTHLIELSQGSQLSRLASGYRMGGFESAGGQWVGFDKWYAPKWTDMRIGWMTQLSPEFGVLWGFSTGEQAEKYRIAPSLKLGFAYQVPLSLRSSFSVRATTIVGGRMTEKACTANYGDIGGIAQVNCRLAASEMAPSQTLNYLTNALPPERHNIWVKYTLHF